MTSLASAPHVRRDNVPLGILYMVGSTLLFAAASAVTKWSLDSYPPGQVAFTRQLFSALMCAAMILPFTGLVVFRTERLGQHTLRGVSQFTSQMCLIMALTMMPLGSAMSISFSAPLFAVLFSVVFFGERVGIHRTAALLLGFVGVLLITEPSTGGVETGALFALANAILYASVTVGVRRMTATESAETLTMYQMLALTVLMALLLPFGVAVPKPLDFALLALAGLGNGLGQFWWTRALGLAPASAIMPFYYLSLAWAIALGFLVWGDVPSQALVAGASVIVVSGLYLIWREKIARQRAVTVASPGADGGRSEAGHLHLAGRGPTLSAGTSELGPASAEPGLVPPCNWQIPGEPPEQRVRPAEPDIIDGVRRRRLLACLVVPRCI